MKKEITVLLVAFTSLFSLSCKKEVSANNKSGFEEMSKSEAARNPQEEGVPFKGEYTDTFQMLHPPPMFVQKIIGTGNATHLGNSTFEAIAHVNRSTPPPFAVTGTRTLTAANGDQLFTTFSGLSIPVAPRVNKTLLHDTIIGGTGRFKNASGSFTSTALSDQNTSTFTASFDGRIIF